MDPSVRRAIEKWPNVPALHGWLALDEAGRWRLQGEPITHPGLIAFINRNYECDEHGQWFFQNGPQRGYVRLDYTPWVVYADGSGQLHTHTEQPVESVAAAYADDDGNLLLCTEVGPALVERSSLPAVVEWLRDEAGDPADPESLASLSSSGGPRLCLRYGGNDAPVHFIRRADVPTHFGFVQDPAPAAD